MTDSMPIMIGGYRAEDNIREMRKDGEDMLVIAVPMALLLPHANQAEKNHSQTLARLRERGGLSACEAVAILEDRWHRPMKLSAANRALRSAISDEVRDAMVEAEKALAAIASLPTENVNGGSDNATSKLNGGWAVKCAKTALDKLRSVK